MIPTLYLTRNGLLEPLGQSQVIAYLRGLARDYRITLITYEKDEDWADTARIAAARAECEQLGIRWLPQRFLPRPKVLAPALSMLRMIWLTRREVRRQGVQMIHARSYIPAAVALVVGRMTNVPFIFDMRALWPEELITAGRLRRGSLLHRAIVSAERTCLKRAAGVVSLTHAAAKYLKTIYPAELDSQRIAIIPTCADLDRFTPAASTPENSVIGCLGTVLSGWFRMDWLVSFLTTVAENNPEIQFELTTRDDADQVRKALGRQLADQVAISSSPSDQVQDVLRRQTASVMFYAGGETSELGRSPTRMAEILGCGLPVVANDGVGDVAEIIREHRVGVLATGSSKQEMNNAWRELQGLLLDPDLAQRCRATAERLFSLDAGTEAYRKLYADILRKAA
ncbi:glycosyltransferase [Sedimentimonas flavescens]|uniref:Glycosyltransferase n=1 Tax=Sedimentimonas flavescens TaxID=2851012 RepID=A0ABT2ZV93_9RHOB|nr:glycosyltransferase [Sedimentimonas flavescens]MCV2877670.1 glycosyltransferase [Sedimentimonas flavescens]